MAERKLVPGGFGLPPNWGLPSPLFNFNTGEYETGGLVWLGKRKAGPKAVQAVKDQFGENVRVDKLTLVGRKNPDYTSFFYENVNKGPYRQPTLVL